MPSPPPADFVPSPNCTGGRLVFVDPRDAAAGHVLSDRYASIQPQPGTLVLFPSWIAHFVEPHPGLRTRLSVSFNIHVVRFSPGNNMRPRAIPRMPFDLIEPAGNKTLA